MLQPLKHGLSAVLGLVAFGVSGPAQADPRLEQWLARPTVRMVVLRAAGADFDWRGFQPARGLFLRVLADCEPPKTDAHRTREDVVCDPGGRWRRALQLSPGRASAWTWQGQRAVFNGRPEDIHSAVARHLGPKPRVWIDTDRPRQHRTITRALEATGRWRVTHQFQDIESLRTFDPAMATATCDTTARPSPLALLRIRGGNAVWFDPQKKCRAIETAASDPGVLARRITDAWRTSAVDDVGLPSSPSTWTAAPASADAASPTAGRLMDRHLRATLRKSHAALDGIPSAATDPTLIAMVRRWIGTRYRRNGNDASGIDDFNLVRQLFKEVYRVELEGEAVDWLERYAKVPIDEKRPEATLRVGDILFKVPLSYRPRGVMLYLGGGQIVAAEDITGVIVKDVPREMPVTFYLVARRPSADPQFGATPTSKRR
ncbi:MAG: NlpC/P60 family protein [Myxococcota bacterium]